MYHKLDENKNVIPSSLKEWADFVEGRLPTNYKHIGDDEVNGKRISTVFLGLCHSFDPCNNVPIVFETMIFDSDHGIYQDRYSTYKEAEDGHHRAIEWVKNGCKHE